MVGSLSNFRHLPPFPTPVPLLLSIQQLTVVEAVASLVPLVLKARAASVVSWAATAATAFWKEEDGGRRAGTVARDDTGQTDQGSLQPQPLPS